MISVEGFSFNYTAGDGVTDLTFEVSDGATLLITGSSGSGKSTIIKALNGLVPNFHAGQYRGTVAVSSNGKTFNPKEEPLSRAVEFSACVFQNPRTQFFTDSVDTELAFALENLGWEPAHIARKIDEVSGVMGIDKLRGRKLKELSGGQLQAVACACALLAPGGLVLFDEPTSNLSESGVDRLRGLIVALRELGKTMVIAEHRFTFLQGLVDDVLYLRDGEIAHRFNGEEFFSLAVSERQKLGLRSLVPVMRPRLSAPVSGELQLSQVRFGYHKSPVVDIDKLSFPAGAVTALVGENGSGKTTLARLICGLEKPRRGCEITLKGYAAKGRCQMVMQDVGRQLFGVTAEEEITLGLPARIAREVDALQFLEELELGACANRHPQSLSGGQRQRLVIAAVRASGAEVVVFDEPSSGLGYEHVKSVARQMREMAQNGVVVIVITHDNELITEAADYLIDMEAVNKASKARAGS